MVGGNSWEYVSVIKYLRVTKDTCLNFKEHCTMTAKIVKDRVKVEDVII